MSRKKKVDRKREITPGSRADLKSKKRRRRSGVSRFFKSRVFLIALALVVIAAAVAAGILIMRQRGDSAAQADTGEIEVTGVTTQSGADVNEVQVETPLASATDQIVASMSLEEKIGQMFMVGFEGPEPDAAIISAIKDKHIGAVILFTRNISSNDQVAQLDATLQTLAVQANQPAKLMIAVDQEGGKTRRFEKIGPYYSQPMIGEMHDAAPDAAQQQASSAARDLKKIGINTNLAPVADVSSGWGSTMDGRSFSQDTAFTAELTGRAIKGYNNATTISCAKHFPGHGSADNDSETALSTVSSDLATIQTTDLPPFQAAVAEGVPMIMVAHLVVPALDATETPSSLSKPIVTDLLRTQMAFPGVIITDDMEMGALAETETMGTAAVAAVLAGNDMLIVAHTQSKQNEAYDAILAAVKAGKIKEADIDKSVARILDMKKKYRLEKQAG
ncbi:MAG: glycoside hydrolase family 3 N-terminal domain-containing protein [Thermoleophilia bacterium]